MVYVTTGCHGLSGMSTFVVVHDDCLDVMMGQMNVQAI